MSSLKLCDSDDCYKSENDCRVFSIHGETKRFLKMYCKTWFQLMPISDICQDCIDNANADYEGFFEVDGYSLKIGSKYINDPTLLD
ncbi:MAG: hypothetical protein R8M45_05065 [Ghiorsea sp.]